MKQVFIYTGVCVHVHSVMCVLAHVCCVLSQIFFDDNIDEERYCGYLFGLGNTYSVTNGNGGYTSNDTSQ